ncbi:TetR/AcrR family transcriptional regulator [Noviherbaspirillum saxi]|uniref:TetR/AcrR family transcriptional regulator n=1 Tax=Noviherbaspirillum saxi TaxID=2320863 RepID=A0A3A3FK68_9BURK|nr:TetR family transcriptional regulator [Noviherbaspirillum saxi]RJF91735.1 TetR/AcrR family transcriptional regulator [Noviherbaspirillum saxi]
MRSAEKRSVPNMRKSERTRAALVQCALQMVCREGFNSVSIGALADSARMSKSGVFARFGSHDELLLDVLRLHHRIFTEQVVVASLQKRQGLPRLQAMFALWAECSAADSGIGKLYLKAAVEFECGAGPVPAELKQLISAWQDTLIREVCRAVDAGDLAASVEPEQFVFELSGIIYAIYGQTCFMRRSDAVNRGLQAFERLVAYSRARMELQKENQSEWVAVE